MSSQERQERIAKRAYELFCARGGAHGNDMDDWVQAEKEIAALEKNTSRKTGQKKTAVRKKKK